MSPFPNPVIIFLLLVLPGLIFLTVYSIYLTLMYRHDGNHNERLFTVGPKAFYDWDLAALISDGHPQLLYKPVEDPPEYSEVAGVSPLPAYYEVLYNDQLITSFNNLTSVKQM